MWVLFFHKLNPFSGKKDAAGKKDTWNLWFKVIVAVLPSAVIGLALDDWMDEHLHTAPVVAAMLIVYGVAFILIERRKNVYARAKVSDVHGIGLKLALCIGCFQALSLVPGTSRSGATILGGVLMGCSRAAASEFSFFMAIPTMAGASLLKLLKFGMGFSGAELLILLVGCVTAFAVSVVAIRTFIGYIKKNSFTAFGWYRIALGALVAGYFLMK